MTENDTQPFSNLISKCFEKGGLGSLSRRKRLWPIINFIKPSDYVEFCAIEKKELDEHRDARIVMLDSERYNRRWNLRIHQLGHESSKEESSDEGISDELNSFSDKISEIILRVLCKNKKLRYYQGFHDIATVFLLVLGFDNGMVLLNIIANKQFRDFMKVDLTHTIKYMEFVLTLIEMNDPELHEFLKKSNVGSVFCLPWILTWFSHEMEAFGLVCRLFDLFMVTNKLMPAYLAATLVMGVREYVLNLNCEIATVHCFLSKIPQNLDSESWEKAIDSSLELFDSFPPQNVFSFQTGYFTHKKLIILSKWLTNKKTRRTILKNSLVKGKAKVIRKQFRQKQVQQNQYFNIGIGVVSIFVVFVGLIYSYRSI